MKKKQQFPFWLTSPRTKHGYNTRKVRISEYSAWGNMIARCENKNHPVYKYYGGRGIKVCDSWKESFVNFLKDMGFKPKKNLELDRINNDGNYEPNNCRWTTRSVQVFNSRHWKRKLK